MAQNIQKYETLGYGSAGGCLARGQVVQVIGDAVATRLLKTEESGAICLLDRAAGVVYTLPVVTDDNIGVQFEFVATVAVTSNAYKVITGLATEFLLGSVMIGDKTVAQSGDVFDADGTSIVAISSDGATTGGLLGSRFKVVCISGTQWVIHGLLQGAGTLATPFATS